MLRASSSWTRPPEQARIAEDAGAVAVMALERVPADIRPPASSPMSDPHDRGIMAAVTIRSWRSAVGHFVEAQVLEVSRRRLIDESEVLTRRRCQHIDSTP